MAFLAVINWIVDGDVSLQSDCHSHHNGPKTYSPIKCKHTYFLCSVRLPSGYSSVLGLGLDLCICFVVLFTLSIFKGS